MERRVVVITGASAGIGAALAELLSTRGASVVLVAGYYSSVGADP